MINFYSTKIKSEIIIGFYRDALKICIPEYLGEKGKYIKKTFRLLHYPHHFILDVRKVAYKIHKSSSNNTKFIILSSNILPTKFANKLVISNIRIFTTSRAIRDIIRKRNKPNTNSDAGINK